ncbi:hypothetical protein L3X38_013860 [Prunus dulcis]|uniref:Uncharacterized protein n=1 Tax=Prunus dulcis TaxID=3755 RepID=A0AAD4ZGJ7_PRUDU|nr:hypothetical protein L3X38_013860 [Prunus dulcis]
MTEIREPRRKDRNHIVLREASIHVFTRRRCSEKNPTAKLYHKTWLGKLQSIVLLSSPENQVLEVYSSKQAQAQAQAQAFVPHSIVLEVALYRICFYMAAGVSIYNTVTRR